MRRWLSVLLAVLLLPVSLCRALETEQAAPVLRALLVSCDRFLSQPETTPAASTNLALMRDALLSDARGYQDIRLESGTLNSAEGLKRAVSEAFGDAGENDISVFYISTHGLYTTSRSNLTAALLLSDGEKEEAVDALALEDIFAPIKGTKVLILDSCNAAALIGKGLSDPADRALFVGKDYKVLCSAGGSEESWYWQSSDGGTRRGASYFASVLAGALSGSSGYPADEDKNGVITLKEAYDYVFGNYAASTPQVYPQEDDTFPLMVYDAEHPAEITDTVTDILFEDSVLTGLSNQITFSFTVRRETSLFYQIVYFSGGRWRFPESQMIKDEEEGERLTPGEKTRVLTLSLPDEALDTSGYAMVQIFSREESGQMRLEGGKLLTVLPLSGDMVLEVRADTTLFPDTGRELAVRVLHDIPCALTVSVQDMQGNTIRYLAFDAPTRPQRLVPEGSDFYWDGTLQNGQKAPTGSYIIRVRTMVSGRTYVAYSGQVQLINDALPLPAQG